MVIKRRRSIKTKVTTSFNGSTHLPIHKKLDTSCSSTRKLIAYRTSRPSHTVKRHARLYRTCHSYLDCSFFSSSRFFNIDTPPPESQVQSSNWLTWWKLSHEQTARLAILKGAEFLLGGRVLVHHVLYKQRSSDQHACVLSHSTIALPSSSKKPSIIFELDFCLSCRCVAYVLRLHLFFLHSLHRRQTKFC